MDLHTAPRTVGDSTVAAPQLRDRRVPRLITLLAFAVLIALCRKPAYPQDLGMTVADGFVVTQFAGDDLCHDVFSMTIDSQGRIVVSGPGYVRILIDNDRDGVADESRQLVDGPRSGAQGMFFYGPDLICTGDAGLLRYRDRDQNDRADGPPDVFLRAKAGTEHDIHAVRKGPDGYWYVISGNSAEIDERYITMPTSPIKKPHAGTIMRFKPDLTSGEVLADGIRNAYDFDFSSSGDLFIFDSDGERDLSLPWYQPTRVFHVLPGSNLGWVSNSMIRPSDSFDMPPTLASLGRSSPTGVVCYRHFAFPVNYHGAIFVLDWTFGRIWALPLEEHGASWKAEPEVFLKADGENGFAPTDAEVGRDGALYVCIGGRGTRGGVFRIAPKDGSAVDWNPPRQTVVDKVNAVVRAPQPLGSWSRAIWEPLSRELGAAPFREIALNSTRPVQERLRAIEVLTEKFDGIDSAAIVELAKEQNPRLRSRAAWSIGRQSPARPDVSALQPFLKDAQPQVARAALETLIGAEPEAMSGLAGILGDQLAHSDLYVRQTAQRVVTRLDEKTYHQTAATAINHGWVGAVPVAAAFSQRQPGFQAYPIDIASRLLRSPSPSLELKADAARLLQMGLGDLGPDDVSLPPAFQGYAARIDLKPHERELEEIRALLIRMYPTEHPRLNRELEKLIAVVRPVNDQLLNRLLARITADTNAVADIHYLIVASRIPIEIRPPQRELIAAALAGLERKIREQELAQDISWDDRVIEVFRGLRTQDSELPIALLNHPDFGEPGHVQFASEMPPQVFQQVVDVFLKRLNADANYVWSPELVYLLGAADNEAARDRVRAKYEDFALRSAVLMSLSEQPRQQDRRFYVQGLESAQLDVVFQCIQALAVLRGSQEAAENVMLVRTLRRMGYSGEERQARDQVAELLQRNLQVTFGYQLAQDGNPQREVIDGWTNLIRERYPEEYTAQVGDSTAEAAELETMLSNIPWTSGEVHRGQTLFTQRGCMHCHGGRKALGPDLTGVAGRFSREDLFTAIAFPHRDVSPRYQTTQIATVQGHVHTGLIVYEYPDALVLRDAQNKSFRIATEDIEERRTLSKSLMPEGLLKDLQPTDLADLYVYLRDLSTRTANRDTENTQLR